MVVSDPVSDTLTRIRNAQAVGHSEVKMPFTKLRLSLVEILAKEGFLGEIDTFGRKVSKQIKVKLRYEKGQPAINELVRVSRPGQRIYKKSDAIKPVKQGFGRSIISTSQGLMTDKEARKNKVGGEVLCKIW